MIRPLQPEDADELAALYLANREFLAPFEPPRPDGFFTADGQRERLAEPPPTETHRYAILDGDAIAGTINVANIVHGPFRSANLGYFVDRARNGRGLATAAVGDVVGVAFGELSLHRLEAGTLVDNVGSQRVLEKNGFERIGIARRYLLIGGDWRDHVLFQRVAD
ncbi:MAG TPA: GNAT family protein [Gaiellaceae bacterium]|jgi:ribosomal-protein-alanine N-acetyltransferase|nr:GNAT family protein [Gaiellaceae bacterium]